MRWLALTLLILNCFIWYKASQVSPSAPLSPADGRGQLPRVADLKPSEGDDAEAALEEVAETPDPVIDDAVANRAPNEPECARLQWFETRELAVAYSEQFIPRARIRELERKLEPLHWVIIPPRPEPQALELFRTLQGKGVDSYLVTEGENRNAISLGLFENPDAARRVLEQRKSQNLNAVLVKFPRNQLSYALDFEVSPGSAPGAGLVLGSWRDNSLALIEISGCQGVASGEKTP